MMRPKDIHPEVPASLFKPADIIDIAGLLLTMHYNEVIEANHLVYSFFSSPILAGTIREVNSIIQTYEQFIIAVEPNLKEQREKQERQIPAEKIRAAIAKFASSGLCPSHEFFDQIETYVKPFIPVPAQARRLFTALADRAEAFEVLDALYYSQIYRTGGGDEQAAAANLSQLEHACFDFIKAEKECEAAARNIIHQIEHIAPDFRAGMLEEPPGKPLPPAGSHPLADRPGPS